MNLDRQSGIKLNFDLLRNENYFPVLLERLHLSYFITSSIRNIKGNITDYIFRESDNSANEIFKKPKEEIIGQSLLKLLPGPEGLLLFEKMTNSVIKEKLNVVKLCINENIDFPERRYFEIEISKFNDGCLLIWHDITKLSLIETELKESQTLNEKLLLENSLLKENLRVERESFQIALSDLYEAKEYFRIMGATIPYGVWMSEADGTIKYVSPSFLSLLNLSMDEVKQYGWLYKIAPEDVESTLKDWQKCINQRQPLETEFRILGRDKKYHTILTKGQPVYDENGNVKAWVGIHLGIDERKESEEQLKIQKNQLLNAEYLANLGNYQIEMPDKTFTWSSGLCRVFELQQDEKRSDLNEFLTFVHPHDRIYVKVCFGQMLYVKKPLENTFRCLLQDGSIKYIRNMGKPILDASGNLTGIFGVMMDITELKLAELNIRKQKNQAELISKASRTLAKAGLETGEVLNVIVQQTAKLIGDACVIRVLSDDNKSIYTAASYHPYKEVLDLMEIVLNKLSTEINNAFDIKVINSKQPVLISEINKSDFPKDLSPIYNDFFKHYSIQSVMIVPLLVYDKVIGTITMFRHPPGPEYQKDELALLQQLADVAAITIVNSRLHQNLLYEINERKKTFVELEKTLVKLERSNKELEQFAYVASHDLQEPIRMVSRYTDLLAKRYMNNLDKDANEFIHYVIDGSKRMQILIRDLLEYSRVSTETKPLEEVDCNEILGSVLTDLKLKINENDADISYAVLPIIKADSVQIRQLFQNLISNALKFCSDKKPEIKINCIKNQKEWCFSVNDNGIGIDSEFYEKIFIIFQRLHDRDHYPGTGIGLAICKKIVKNLGGNIWVESKKGEGSTFYFTIPL